MQADSFTIKSQEAISAARDIAAARRNPQVGPNHLLLALLEQQETLVIPVLTRLGVVHLRPLATDYGIRSFMASR